MPRHQDRPALAVHPKTVQYGESMVGQDRAEHFGFSGRGGGGGTKGGDAGSRNKPGQDVNFIRHVPKFLQVREKTG